MIFPKSRNRAVLAATIGAVLALGVIGQANAQRSLAERERAKQEERSEKSSRSGETSADQLYPLATREQPELEVSDRVLDRIEEMTELHAEGKKADARVIADEIIVDEDASDYAKAYAAQLAAQIAYDNEEIAAATEYFAKTIALDGLDNNAHYGIMLNLAQLQQAKGQTAESLATYERFFKETGSTDPAHLMMKGQGLYLMERYPEAASVMKQAIDASDAPKPEWQALLMQAYAKSGQGESAIAMAEAVAAAKPDDKRAQMNLAVVYQQAGMTDKATAVLERLRASGQLSEAGEYRQLYSTYINMEGQETQAVEVINEGLQKGILEPDFNTYAALAQGYYFSGQVAPAIEAYRTAAPLDADGSTYLNLAKILRNEGRDNEAKAAAKQALAKGIEQPEEATAIIEASGS